MTENTTATPQAIEEHIAHLFGTKTVVPYLYAGHVDHDDPAATPTVERMAVSGRKHLHPYTGKPLIAIRLEDDSRVLFAVAFIIWWILAMIARSKTGRISTKRLLVLIGMAGIAVTLALLSGEGGVSPWIDVAIVNIGFVPLFLLIVGLYIAMPFAVASAVLVVIARLMARIWSGPKHQRNTSAAGLLSKGEQS